jgi:hypothetical protein
MSAAEGNAVLQYCVGLRWFHALWTWQLLAGAYHRRGHAPALLTPVNFCFVAGGFIP